MKRFGFIGAALCFIGLLTAAGIVACGGGAKSGDDDDNAPAPTVTDRCVTSMTGLFGPQGCALANNYSPTEIDGFCTSAVTDAGDSECKKGAVEDMATCMEAIDCADSTQSYHAWTDCQINYGDATTACSS